MMVTDRPEDGQKKMGLTKKYDGQKAPFNLGFTVIDPTHEIRTEWGLPDDLKQPVIVSTEPKSEATKSGLRQGDVILDVNKTAVESSKDVLKLLKKGQNTLRIARKIGRAHV